MDKIINSKVSVIIPCYNAELYVEKAVLSIMNQTYKNLEIICLDDGSTDGTIKILNELAKNDSRLVVVKNQNNLKLIKTLNLGLQLVTGDFIARMDSDDFSVFDRIEKQLKYLEENDIDVCGTYTYYYYDNRKPCVFKKIHCISSSKSLRISSLFDSPLIHPSVLGKSSVFKQFMYNDCAKSYLIEDYEMWCRMFKNNVKIGVLPEYLLYYRINDMGESITKKEIQNKNKLSLSRDVIFETIEISLSMNSISLISGIKINERISLAIIKLAIKDLNQIFEQSKIRYELTKNEIVDMRKWLKHKLFHLHVQTVRYGVFKAKIFSLIYLSFQFQLILMYIYNYYLQPYFMSFLNQKEIKYLK